MILTREPLPHDFFGDLVNPADLDIAQLTNGRELVRIVTERLKRYDTNPKLPNGELAVVSDEDVVSELISSGNLPEAITKEILEKYLYRRILALNLIQSGDYIDTNNNVNLWVNLAAGTLFYWAYVKDTLLANIQLTDEKGEKKSLLEKILELNPANLYLDSIAQLTKWDPDFAATPKSQWFIDASQWWLKNHPDKISAEKIKEALNTCKGLENLSVSETTWDEATHERFIARIFHS